MLSVGFRLGVVQRNGLERPAGWFPRKVSTSHARTLFAFPPEWIKNMNFLVPKGPAVPTPRPRTLHEVTRRGADTEAHAHSPRDCPSCPLREAVDDGGGAAASGFALTPTTATSRCTYIDLFSEYPSQDPRIPGGVPPPLGPSSVGCVLRGSVHGRPAAVKIIDLWKVDKDVLKVRAVANLPSLLDTLFPAALFSTFTK